MAYDPTQKRHAKGAPMAGAWAPDSQRGGAASVQPRPLQLRDDWDALSLDEKKADVERYIHDALREHGRDDWTVGFTRGRNTLGSAYFLKKKINVSLHAIEYGQEQAKNVAMHEVAHVLAGATENHGPKWKAIAQALGSDGKARHSITIERPKRSVSRKWRGSMLSFEEGVTSFEYGGKNYVVEEVRRTRLHARREDGTLFDLSIDQVGKLLTTEKLDQAKREELIAFNTLVDEKGRDFALRAAHGLETGPETHRLQASVAKSRALDGMIEDRTPMPTFSGKRQQKAAEVLAKKNISASVSISKRQLGDTPFLHQVAIKTENAIASRSVYIPSTRSAPMSLAEVMTDSKYEIGTMELSNWDRDQWIARTGRSSGEFTIYEMWTRAVKDRYGDVLDKI